MVPIRSRKGTVPEFVNLEAGLVGKLSAGAVRFVVFCQATVEDVMVLPFQPVVVPSA